MKYLVLLAASVCAFAQSTFTPLQPITGTANITPCTGCKIVANYITDALSTMNAAGSPYTVFGLDSYILCDATAGPVVINLPTATGTGRELSVKKIDSTSNACTPTRNASDTIDGATSFSLTVQYAASKLVDAAAGKWHRSHITQMGGDLSGLNTAATVAKIQGKAADVPTTKGDLYVFDGTAIKRLGVGTNTQVLTADSAQTLGVKWAAGGGGGGSASVGANDAVESSDGAGAFKDSGCAAPSGVMTCAGFATTYTGAAQTVDIKQGTAPAAQAANTFRLQANATIGTAYKWIVPSADAAGVIASDGSGALSVKGINANNGVAGLDSGGKALAANSVTAGLAGVLKYTAGVPTAIGTSSTNCVHEDGSSGACASSGGDVYLAGNNAMTGSNSFSKDVTLSGTLTPTALGADVNNYNPTNCATSLALRVDGGAADRNITGLLCASSAPADGRIVTLINIGATNALVLKNESSSSTAANRFLLPADTTLPVNTAMALRYDGTSSRWRPWSRALANSGVTAGTYGDSTHVGQFTVDAAGRMTAASSVAVSAGADPFDFTLTQLVDDFVAVQYYATVSSLWSRAAYFAAATGGTAAFRGLAGVADHPGILQMETGATTGNGLSFRATNIQNLAPFNNLPSLAGWEMQFIFRLNSNTLVKLELGFLNGGSPAVPTDGVFLRFDNYVNSDTKFTAVCRSGSANTISTTNMPNVDTAWHKGRIRSTVAGTILFSIDGGTETSIASGCPTGVLSPGLALFTGEAVLKNVDLDAWAWKFTSLSR